MTQLWLIEPSRFAAVLGDGASRAPGLAMLATDGDFADRGIADSGRWLGGEVLATFDRKSAALLEAQGQPHCPGKTPSSWLAR